MASMNSDSWKKSASFYTLSSAVRSLVEAHTVADVISLVANELPIDTGSAFQESQTASKLIVDSVLNVEFLEPIAWLSAGGNEVKITDPSDLKGRPADIQFIRFRCQMHGSTVDARVIDVPDLSFYFCLKLPQSTYDDATDKVTAISSSTPIQRSRSLTARSLSTCFNATGDTPPPKPSVNTLTPAVIRTSPAMKLFLST